MEYRRYDNTVIVRMDPDDEIIENVMKIIEKENIKLAQINALGAVKEFTTGAYNVAEQKYYKKDYSGSTFEVVSLHGNVTTKDGAPYLHLHMGAGGHTGEMMGGHLNRAVIGGTCEMFITIYEGNIDRKICEKTGLNVFDFKD